MALFPVIIMVVGVCSSLALALPPMGPPKAILGENQWAIGFEYAHQKMDLELFGKGLEKLVDGERSTIDYAPLEPVFLLRGQALPDGSIDRWF